MVTNYAKQIRVGVGPWTSSAPVIELTDWDALTFNGNAQDGCEVQITARGDTPAAEQIDEMATDVWLYAGTTLLQRFRVLNVAQTWGIEGEDVITLVGGCHRRMMYRRELPRDLRFDQVGQGDIVWALVQETQHAPGGYLGLTAGTLDNSVLRDRSYFEGENIGELIENLERVIDGPLVEFNGAKQVIAHAPGSETVHSTPIMRGATARQVTRQSGSDLFANVVNGTGDTNVLDPYRATAEPLAGYWTFTEATGDGVTTSTVAGFNAIGGDFTVVGKVTPASGQTASCIIAQGYRGGSTIYGWQVTRGTTGNIGMSVRDTSGNVAAWAPTGTYLPDGETTCWAFTYDETGGGTGSYFKLYISADGVDWSYVGGYDVTLTRQTPNDLTSISIANDGAGTLSAMPGDIHCLDVYDGLQPMDTTGPDYDDLLVRISPDGRPSSGGSWTSWGTAITEVDYSTFTPGDARGRWETSVSWSTVIDPRTLIEHVEGEVAERISPAGSWVVDLKPERWFTDLPLRLDDKATIVTPRTLVAPVGTPTTSVLGQVTDIVLNVTPDGLLTIQAALIELPSES